MSMLAERKRKQKWCLNPRGKLWSEDANKFGQKMLERMGWQSGKGLGVNENGITEHVKISYKNDSQGMGYKASDDQWTEHENKFTALLEALGGETESIDKTQLKSLEKKSQVSKARVHYQKFTRGKDLSQYSEKDLANIFGKKSLKEFNKKTQHEHEQVDEASSRVPSEENSTSLLINGGSMKDYFQKKLPNYRKTNGYVLGSNGVLKKADSESENELASTAGFGFKSTKDETVENSNKYSFISYIKEESGKRKSDDHVDTLFSPTKKVKKEKHGCESSGLANPVFNPISTPLSLTKHILHTIEENSFEEIDVSHKANTTIENIDISDSVVQNGEKSEVNSNKKKKKKSKIFENNAGEMPVKKSKKEGINNPFFDNQIEESLSSVDNNAYEVKIKKDKKNKKEDEVENVGIDNPVFVDQTQMNVVKSKKNKKKKSKEKTLEIDPVILEDTSTATTENLYEIKRKRKKKVQQTDDNNGGIENPYFEDNNINRETSLVENPYEVKPKKKKKSKIYSEINYALDESSFIEEQNSQHQNNAFEVTRKKTKKKQKDNEISQEVTDVSQSESLSTDACDLMLNVVCEPVLPKSAKIENVGSIENTYISKRRKSVRFSDVTQEIIIPNKEQLKRMENGDGGIDNENFDTVNTQVNENLDTISKTLDRYQAEIENDINEQKQVTIEDIMVGEIGNPHGENEKLPNGTKLKFRYANFDSRSHMYHLSQTGAKKSYKHLIKGDILVNFKNTNLHEIKGYANVKRKNAT